MSFFTADQLALLSGRKVIVDFLVEMQFQSSTVRLWNGYTDLVTGGFTWSPLKGAAAIDGLGVSGGTVSESVTFTLNGLPDQAVDLLGLALAETPDVDQQLVKVYLQLFAGDDHPTVEAWQPAGSPLAVFWGFLQPPKVSRAQMSDTQGAVQSISITAENVFFNRSKPPNGRFTDRDQQTRHPGDKFFQFTPNLLFKTFTYPDF